MAGLDESARQQLKLLGDFIRDQRQQAELSLRELAARTNVSNPYLSQIERGLHEPSVRVIKAIALALNVSAESLLRQAGMLEQEMVDEGSGAVEPRTTEEAIASDRALSAEQRADLLAIYRSYMADNGTTPRPRPPKAKANTRKRPGG